jgi:hypothetical protein
MGDTADMEINDCKKGGERGQLSRKEVSEGSSDRELE